MKAGLLWVSCGKDLEWFRYSAKSYTKFVTGFTQAICAVPEEDKAAFAPVCHQHGIELIAYPDWPGKGFLRHMDIKCRADQLFTPDIEYIYHIDSDCIFTSRCSYVDFLVKDKPVLDCAPFQWLESTHRDWKYLFRWKRVSEEALGFQVDFETMQSLPIVYYRSVYSKTRNLVSNNVGKDFSEYLSLCKNSFPQSFCEFNTLGTVALNFFTEKYFVWDRSKLGKLLPYSGRLIQFWSHGGLDGVDENQNQTARQVLLKLDLI